MLLSGAHCCVLTLMGHVPHWVEKMCLKAANGKVQWWSLEVFPHYWQSLTVRVHYSQSSTAFWCHWQTLAKFTHHFRSPKVIFEVHQSLSAFPCIFCQEPSRLNQHKSQQRVLPTRSQGAAAALMQGQERYRRGHRLLEHGRVTEYERGLYWAVQG